MSALLEYKCPCCGGAIEFNSSVQKMKCPYCDTEFEMETLRALDEELKKEQPDDMNWESEAGSQWQEGEADRLRSYVCSSCGGEIVGDETLAAASCPFCGNPVVMTEQFSGDLKPDCVIPFKLDKNAAKQGLLRHLKGKKFLPKIFKDENHIDEIKGVYVPFWLFDADAQVNVRYKATRVNTWRDRNYVYTQTHYYSVHRSGTLSFNHVPVDGSKRMPDDLMESIEPYNFKSAVDFQTAYLAGYFADKYDVTADECVKRANERIRLSAVDAFSGTVKGYSAVIPENSSVRLKSGREKYALCPVWLLNTSWKGETYTFAMNGQTGKFVGDLPLDKGAFFKWWGIIGAAVSAVVYGLFWLVYLL